jgi:hypothetical protein
MMVLKTPYVVLFFSVKLIFLLITIWTYLRVSKSTDSLIFANLHDTLILVSWPQHPEKSWKEVCDLQSGCKGRGPASDISILVTMHGTMNSSEFQLQEIFLLFNNCAKHCALRQSRFRHLMDNPDLLEIWGQKENGKILVKRQCRRSGASQKTKGKVKIGCQGPDLPLSRSIILFIWFYFLLLC